ncbi:hypothetical protein PLICRDRAFT_171257 [Plicaturopsis crispa FD-325 SS-3]|nr:hypothetical protein PLICRDRAFT_171257 [Plicaturopsis crispa FD-325 SS-3]
MSVATKNPFALLDAEDSSRPSTPAVAPKANATPAAAPAPAARGGAQKPRGGPASRGGRYYARGGKAGAADDVAAADAPAEGNRKFEGEGRGRGRGGRGRGGARGAGGGGGRGRPFDRQSQTGKTDSDKKLHNGWGGEDPVQELQAEVAAETDANAEAAAPDGDAWGAPAGGDSAAWAAPAGDADAAAPAAEDGEKRGRREREPEEEDNTLTLEQYLAQKKDESVVPKLEARKANEGAEDWKDVTPLAKGAEAEYFAGKAKSAPKPRVKKEEKVFLEIDAHFERPSRGPPRGGRGGERGGRGGDRGGRGTRGDRGAGRGRGAPRGRAGNNGAANVNVDDETAFPSLS